jgi:hypothetical protein
MRAMKMMRPVGRGSILERQYGDPGISSDKSRVMQVPRMLFKIRGLAFVSALTALVLGGSILFFREFAPFPTSAALRAKNPGVIMEGVDINSNGRGHFRPERSTERQRHLPPDVHSGAAR